MHPVSVKLTLFGSPASTVQAVTHGSVGATQPVAPCGWKVTSPINSVRQRESLHARNTEAVVTFTETSLVPTVVVLSFESLTEMV
jgi:hypothetical protein